MNEKLTAEFSPVHFFSLMASGLADGRNSVLPSNSDELRGEIFYSFHDRYALESECTSPHAGNPAPGLSR